MKSKNTRYFGMTKPQLGILAGAAAATLLVICGLSWFVFMAPPAATATPPTATEIPPTPSPRAQEAVATPTPTPAPEAIATSAPPSGWVEFHTPGATLWLPANFIGGDMVASRSETINKVSRWGHARFNNTIKAMRQAPSQLVMWVIDKNISQSPVITSLLVTHEVKEEDTSIEQYLQDSLTETSAASSMTVYETKKITLLGREARRITYQQKIQAGYEIAGIAYYIKDGNNFWILDYNLDPNESVNMKPIVEQSIHTFNLDE